MKYFIDTNIFLRVIVKEDDVSYQECFDILHLAKTNRIQIVTSTVVLAEVLWTLKSYYKIDKVGCIEAIQSIINIRGLQIIDTFDHQKALQYYSDNSQIKYIDCLIASIITTKQSGYTIISYDKDFDKIIEVKNMRPNEVSTFIKY